MRIRDDPIPGKDGQVWRSVGLAVLMRKGEVAAAARAASRHLTVGRSSNCDLRVDDPRFPRKAGEVIIEPVPLFRPAPPKTPQPRSPGGEEGGEKGGGEVHPLQGGRRIPLGGYVLTWVPPGGILPARRSRPPSRAPLIIPGALSLLLLLIGFMPRAGGKSSLLPPLADSSLSNPVTISLPRPGPAPAGTPGQTPRPAPRTALPPLRSSSLDPPRQSRQGRSSPAANPLEGLEEVLEAAKSSLARGEVRGAGELLAPVLPLLDRERAGRLKEALEPLAREMLREARIRSPYEGEKAWENVRELGRWGLGSFLDLSGPWDGRDPSF